jgi:nucleolar protein 12
MSVPYKVGDLSKFLNPDLPVIKFEVKADSRANNVVSEEVKETAPLDSSVKAKSTEQIKQKRKRDDNTNSKSDVESKSEDKATSSKPKKNKAPKDSKDSTVEIAVNEVNTEIDPEMLSSDATRGAKKQSKRDAQEATDDGTNKSNKAQKTQKLKLDHSKDERNNRTIFVGNLHNDVTEKQLEKEFSQYGKIESSRFRSIAISNPKMPKKGAAITKSYHESRDSKNAYIVYVTEESATKALAHNGKQFFEKTLRVDNAGNSSQVDNKKSIFVGNIAFDAKEEEIRQVFQPYGTIENVRIVRDNITSIGKGFCFVEFATDESVQKSIAAKNIKLGDRVLRVTKVSENAKPAVGASAARRLGILPNEMKKHKPRHRDSGQGTSKSKDKKSSKDDKKSHGAHDKNRHDGHLGHKGNGSGKSHSISRDGANHSQSFGKRDRNSSSKAPFQGDVAVPGMSLGRSINKRPGSHKKHHGGSNKGHGSKQGNSSKKHKKEAFKRRLPPRDE